MSDLHPFLRPRYTRGVPQESAEELFARAREGETEIHRFNFFLFLHLGIPTFANARETQSPCGKRPRNISNISNSFLYNFDNISNINSLKCSFVLNNKKNKKKNLNKSNSVRNSFLKTNFSLEEKFLTNMENILSEIKIKKFEKYSNEIKEKKLIKENLEKSILNLQKEINIYNNKKKYWLKENFKVEKQINFLRNENEKIKENNFYIKNENKILPKDLEKLIQIKKDENIKLESEILIEKNQIKNKKEKIQEINKLIFFNKKEIDNIKEALKIIKNHIKTIKEKLIIQNQKNFEVFEIIKKIQLDKTNEI